jgi:hypothetical protein
MTAPHPGLAHRRLGRRLDPDFGHDRPVVLCFAVAALAFR